jgi:hypothetical protein
MDIVIFLAMMIMVVLTIVHLSAWSKEKWAIASHHLRSAGIMLLCFTVLAVLVFGMRLFLKPDVQVAYRDSTQDMFSNLTIAKDDTRVLEMRKLQTCDVVFYKSYPLFVVVGRDLRTNKYKMPCDALTTDMKSDVAAMLSYLKEENRNVK